MGDSFRHGKVTGMKFGSPAAFTTGVLKHIHKLLTHSLHIFAVRR